MADCGHERIVGAITKAALDPMAWQGVTDAIVDAFPGTKIGIIGYNATMARGIPAAYSGYDPSFRPSYETHYSRVIPKLARRLTLPLGQVVNDREIVSEAELLRSEFYSEWLRPQGDARHGAITVLQRGPGRVTSFVARVEHRVAGRLIEPVMQAMRSVYPSMQHALEVNQMMLGLRLDSALLRLGVEPDGAAVLLLGPKAGILYANARAETLLADGSLIQADQLGRMCFADGSAAIRLAAALDPRSGIRRATFKVMGLGRPHNVRLMRLGPDAMGQIEVPTLTSFSMPRLLLVLRPAASAVNEAKHIADHLRLTRTEAEVALAIADGATVAEVAASRGVSIHTVREQVKTALSKTGSRRQADLVRTVEAVRHSR